MKIRYKHLSLLLVLIIVTLCFSFVGCNEEQVTNDEILSKNTNVGVGKFLNFASKTNESGLCDFTWNFADDSIIDSTTILQI